MSDGSLYTDVRYANSPEYNNEKSCDEAGRALVDQEQMRIGKKAGTTYYICKVISFEEIMKAIGKPGTNI